jgi:hypothetical protein
MKPISSVPLINVSFTTDDEEHGEKLIIFTPIMKTSPFGNNWPAVREQVSFNKVAFHLNALVILMILIM